MYLPCWASGVLFLRRLNVHNMYNIYLLTFGLKSWVCLGIQGHTPAAAHVHENLNNTRNANLKFWGCFSLFSQPFFWPSVDQFHWLIQLPVCLDWPRDELAVSTALPDWPRWRQLLKDRTGDQRGVNGSLKKFSKKTRPMSRIQPDAPLF